MPVYVVVTEEWYGGAEKLKIFGRKEHAEQYARSFGDNINTKILVKEIEIR